MGTNYYFDLNKEIKRPFKEIEKCLNDVENVMSCELRKELMQRLECLEDTFKIHICKTSLGWNPIIWTNKHYRTFKEMLDLYNSNKGVLVVVDEYGEEVSMEFLVDKMEEFRDKATHGLEAEKMDFGMEWIDEESGYRCTGHDFS